jgi:hypothetical protein
MLQTNSEEYNKQVELQLLAQTNDWTVSDGKKN